MILTIDPTTWSHSPGDPIFQETFTYEVHIGSVFSLGDLDKTITVKIYDCDEDIPTANVPDPAAFLSFFVAGDSTAIPAIFSTG